MYLVGPPVPEIRYGTNIVYTKSVQCFGYSYFGLGIEESIRELFPFPKSRFNNLESRDVTVIPKCKSLAKSRVSWGTSENLQQAGKGSWSEDVGFVWYECSYSRRGLEKSVYLS